MNINQTVTVFGFYSLTLVIYFSFLEWWVHRHLMHKKTFNYVPVCRNINDSHLSHHREYSTNHYECSDTHHHHEPVVQKIWFGSFVAIIGSIPWIILEFLTTFEFNFSIICFVGIYVYYWIFEIFHIALHEGNSWQRSLLKNTGIFKSVYKHHQVHHAKFNFNSALVNPLIDYVFGTKFGASRGLTFILRIGTISVVSKFIYDFCLIQIV